MVAISPDLFGWVDCGTERVEFLLMLDLGFCQPYDAIPSRASKPWSLGVGRICDSFGYSLRFKQPRSTTIDNYFYKALNYRSSCASSSFRQSKLIRNTQYDHITALWPIS